MRLIGKRDLNLILIVYNAYIPMCPKNKTLRHLRFIGRRGLNLILRVLNAYIPMCLKNKS